MFVARDVEVSPVVTTNRGEGTIRALKHAKDRRVRQFRALTKA